MALAFGRMLWREEGDCGIGERYGSGGRQRAVNVEQGDHLCVSHGGAKRGRGERKKKMKYSRKTRV